MAVQLARHAGAEVAEEGADLLFDTVGGELPGAERVVSIAMEAPGATYFIVEPDRERLRELARLAGAGELVPAVDSTYSLERARERSSGWRSGASAARSCSMSRAPSAS